MKKYILSITLLVAAICGCKDKPKEPFTVIDCGIKLGKNQGCIFSYDYNYWVVDTTDNDAVKAVNLSIKKYLQGMDSINNNPSGIDTAMFRDRYIKILDSLTGPSVLHPNKYGRAAINKGIVASTTMRNRINEIPAYKPDSNKHIETLNDINPK